MWMYCYHDILLSILESTARMHFEEKDMTGIMRVWLVPVS